MQGVPSALVARNESWVRQQAQALVRHLPANVEKADLIQAGLIAVAQASLSFEWEGDRDSEEAREAFVRYARSRVKGAMLDELRQMDVLSRAQRRKIKVVQIARERWRAANHSEPALSDVAKVCGMQVDEVALLDSLAEAGRPQQQADEGESGFSEQHTPATERDEVEARVDTAIVLRRLEAVFARLPERERQVIDAYLGIGLSPVELAATLKVTPSRVAQIYAGVVRRLAVMFGHAERATDRLGADKRAELERLVQEREGGPASTWGRMVEDVLVSPAERFGVDIDVPEGTRW
jgi:RNA polymerase sigma factor for flagellar operon FliA